MKFKLKDVVKNKFAWVGAAITFMIWLYFINTNADSVIPIWIIPVGFIIGGFIKR